ncbi:MAG TPA: 2Fe-2S iron-sulfur cluster-binding protein, partial [Allosphingosinicella sp.]|nr:2Fe-2S iron-sulfur cluster-binding protein [Allosphingosinicella sp.]
MIRFLLDGEMVEIPDPDPTGTVLDYLRYALRRTGTKEGCAEGDCGACTVLLGELAGDGVEWRAVNACILFLPMLDGKALRTVESLGGDHPVQREMVERHGSQCGFCTPGFVMSIFALYQSTDGKVGRGEVNDWIAGNLCRCTGYRPIVEAALAACSQPRRDRFRANAGDTAGLLAFLADSEDLFVGDEDNFFAAPASIDSFADLYERHPEATVVAGATDVGLWITKQLRDLQKIIHVGRVRGFDRVEDTGYELIVGAAATYATVEPHFRAI